MAEMSRPVETEQTQAKEADGSAVYEIGFHINPALTEGDLGAVVEKVRQALGQAEIISQRYPERLKLAYTIELAHTGKREKFTEGYFGAIKFATAREAIPALEVALRGMKEIIRFLLIETTRQDQTPAPRRAVFTSDRLEGEVIHKPAAPVEEKAAEVSQEELDKSIDALVSE